MPHSMDPDPSTEASGLNPRKRQQRSQASRDKSTKKSKSLPLPLPERSINAEEGINDVFSDMDSQLLADYIAQRTRQYEPDLSLFELVDKHIPATVIQDTTSWTKPRNLENLPSFLETFSCDPEKLRSSSKKHGTPHTIIVAAAGLRAADLLRVLRQFQTKDAKVAKLFAKHIKLKDAVDFLNSTRVGIAVGTPARLRQLTESGALRMDGLERILLDASHIDQKKRGLLEIKDTQVPLANWLGQDLKERFISTQENLRLLFY